MILKHWQLYNRRENVNLESNKDCVVKHIAVYAPLKFTYPPGKGCPRLRTTAPIG